MAHHLTTFFYFYSFSLTLHPQSFSKTNYHGRFQIKKQQKKYDVVIVGSGDGGGMAAYVLSKAGLSVCLIEGLYVDPQKNVTQLKNPWDSPPAAPVPNFAPLATLMPTTGDGI